MPNETRMRRSFAGVDKIAILRELLIEKIPLSQLCDKHGLQPTQLYSWQEKLFEEGAAVFDQHGGSKSTQSADARRVEALEAKVQQKNEVLAELMGEHVALKKSLGQI